jgi:hypothetical protein
MVERGDRAGEKSAADRDIGHEADPELAHERQQSVFCLT